MLKAGQYAVLILARVIVIVVYGIESVCRRAEARAPRGVVIGAARLWRKRRALRRINALEGASPIKEATREGGRSYINRRCAK